MKPGSMSALDVVSGLVLEDGRRWAEAAVDVQLADTQAWLFDPRPYHYSTRARGYSKTADAAGVALAVLVTAEPGARLFWLAADADQGRLALESIEGFVRRTPGLDGMVDVQANRVLAQSGSTLSVLPADAAGAWGLRPDWAFVDELAQWAETPSAARLWDAVSTAMTKRPDARMVVITTAGSPRHPAFKVLTHAKGSELWRVSETPGPAPWTDAARLAEQRARLPGGVYRQLYENEWAEVSGDFLDAAVVDAAFRLDGPTLRRVDGRRYVASLDLGHVNDRTVFAVGHREGEQTHLDLMRVWSGSKAAPVSFDEVGQFVRELAREYRCEIVVDPWQALDMVERLRKAGVRVREFHFSPQSKMRLASTLLGSLNTGMLALYPADGLRDELVGLRLKQSGAGFFAFDHGPGEHDDRAVALALMLVEAIENGAAGATTSYSGIPRDPNAVEIEKGDLVLRGARHLDQIGGGRTALPPGWTETKNDDRRTA